MNIHADEQTFARLLLGYDEALILKRSIYDDKQDDDDLAQEVMEAIWQALDKVVPNP